MTNKELNRDIKRLKSKIDSFKTEEGKLDPYFKFIEEVAKPEFLRLFGADQEFTAMNLQSIKIMLRLNIKHRFVAFHQFGLMIKD